MIITCIICGQKYDMMRNDYVCPYCGWMNTFEMDGEDDWNPANLMTRRQARENYRKGRDVFGDPLEKRPPDDTEEK